jgi:hypothetical protein
LEPINENESVQQLAPKKKGSEYISLNVKEWYIIIFNSIDNNF